MSENQKQIPGTQITENPDKTINMMGIQVDLSTRLGEELAKILSCQFTEEEMEALLTYIKSDMFTTSKSFIEDEKDKIIVKQILKSSGNSWSNTPDKYEPASPIVSYVTKSFHDKYKEQLLKKLDEIIDSEEYQKRIDTVANEVLDYVVEGYKDDLKKSIKNRMCTLSDPGMNEINATNLRAIFNKKSIICWTYIEDREDIKKYGKEI